MLEQVNRNIDEVTYNILEAIEGEIQNSSFKKLREEVSLILDHMGKQVVETDVLLYTLALGGIGFVAMTLALTYGVTHMPVHRSAIILLFELVAGALSAQLLTDEVVRLNEWIGGALIITAAWFEAHRHLRAP